MMTHPSGSATSLQRRSFYICRTILWPLTHLVIILVNFPPASDIVKYNGFA
jgi:hypothetical protein